jgi:hypothetical protein
MKNIVKEKPLIQNAFEILLKELGPEKTIRLWQVLGIFDEDYLKLRKKLFKAKSLNQIYKEVKRFNIMK